MLPRHHEELAHHARPLSDILLHQLRPRHTDKAAVGVVSHRTRQQRLPRPWGAVEEDSLGLGDAERFEDFGVLDGELDNLLDLLDLLLESTNRLVRRVGNLLHAHQGHQRVDLAGKDLVKDIAVVTEGDAEVGLDLGDINRLVQVNHILALRIHLDENLVLAHGLDDLANVAARLLQQLKLLSEHPHLCVELVPLRLQPPQVLRPLPVNRLQLLDLPLIVRVDPRLLRRGRLCLARHRAQPFSCRSPPPE
mmetsp:Transcript_28705/g.56057  ORF Transcript_28705/g.56057 Transcript_28705/m.56057 type:complete len:250 (-) Transcript_28705:165-914(-)